MPGVGGVPGMTVGGPGTLLAPGAPGITVAGVPGVPGVKQVPRLSWEPGCGRAAAMETVTGWSFA